LGKKKTSFYLLSLHIKKEDEDKESLVFLLILDSKVFSAILDYS